MNRLLIASVLVVLACKAKTPEESASPATPKTESPPQVANPLTSAPKPEKPEDLPPPADVAAAPGDAVTSESGLASKVLQPGTGTEHPKKWDKVEVHYTGWMTDGKMFDSSVTRGKPLTIPLDRVIPGWTEGVQLMVVGEKRRLWIPAKLAYGDEEASPHAWAPRGTLVFDIELLGIENGVEPPQAPEDVAAVPKGAKTEKSGLASRVLKKGTGRTRPSPTSSVKVHYTGWKTNGEMFDSSVTRGEPITFPLNRVIPGWTEGLQLMVEGEKRRLWIPGKLAYGEESDRASRPGGVPLGMLVFDVELLEIVN